MQSMLHVRIDPLDQMENLRQFFVDPRIDKPWGEYSKGKATRTVRLQYTNRGAKERQQQHASGYRPIDGVMTLELPADDWRKEIVEYLKDPSKKVSRRIRFQATKYVLLEGELYYRMID